MTRRRLIWRSLGYYWRTNLGVVLGAAVGTMVVIGALAVGDSVTHSLRQMALQRLGRTRLVLASGDRFVRDALAGDLADALGVDTAGLLVLRGAAVRQDGAGRANQVQLLGVDDSFWRFDAGGMAPEALGDEQVVLNARLARQLEAEVGDEVLLRIEKPGTMPRDMALAGEEDASVVLRATVQSVVSDQSIGRFSLQAGQIPPYNAFVSRPWLQRQLSMEGRANLILMGEGVSAGAASEGVGAVWRLGDAELALDTVNAGELGGSVGQYELTSTRVFIDGAVTEALSGVPAMPGVPGVPVMRVLTYFVNELRSGDRATPYSMVTAIDLADAGGAGGIGGDRAVEQNATIREAIRRMSDQQIVINQWLADDLAAGPGDSIELGYFVMGDDRRLVERTAAFKVVAVVPMTGLAADAGLMPAFPGLADAEHCREWEPGVPVELEKIRDKDEAYWDQYRGTPKAFIALAAGQKLWANRFGDLTAVRLAAADDQAAVERQVLSKLSPEKLALQVRDVRSAAIAAAEQALPFGTLFLSLSFFVIVAAMLLTALLFVFGIEQRHRQIGTLMAVGWPAASIRSVLLGEGVVLAAVGSIAGIPGGLLYAFVVLEALASVWRGAVASAAVTFHVSPATLLIGAAGGVVMAGGAMWVTLSRLRRLEVTRLIAGGGGEVTVGRRRPYVSVGIGVLSILVTIGVLIGRPGGGESATGMFFGVGTLLLVGGLSFVHALLSLPTSSKATAKLTFNGLSLRNAVRRRGRSLTTAALLGCGVFVIVAVGAFRLTPPRDTTSRETGTGGFALIGESALPVVRNLDDTEVRETYGIEQFDTAAVSFVPMRVRAGDDASCLNLNRAQSPRLMGVRPKLLAQRGAFKFAGAVEGAAKGESPWELLHSAADESKAIPAVADDATVKWALGKKIGDTLSYVDERGQAFDVRIVATLANSVLQGSIIIDEAAFLERFGSSTGHRLFLIDGSAAANSDLRDALSRAFDDVGMSLTPAADRLGEFNAVQNTYLSIFQALGGLGLVLASAGLGMVVMRNVLERRGELALLAAVGYRRRQVRRLIVTEHGMLLVLGLACGVVAAGVAVAPSVGGGTYGDGVLLTAVTVVLVLVSGLVWVNVAAWAALRGAMMAALRAE